MSPIPGLSKVGLLGGGVIGGGWAARFLLNGVDVQMFDPDPEAPRKVGEVMANARRALDKLVMPALAGRGHAHASWRRPRRRPPVSTSCRRARPSGWSSSSRCSQRASAVAPARRGVRLVHLRAAADRDAAGHDPPRAAGRRPPVQPGVPDAARRDLRRRAHQPRPPRTVPPRSTTRSACTRCSSSKEIDGFVADRLMEALWREALWMVNDGVATAAGDRRRDPLRPRPALELHGHVPHLPHRRRRGGHAPLHGPVRPVAEVAVDQAHRRPRAHRRTARHPRRPERRAGGQRVAPRAGDAARRLPHLGDPGSAHARLRRRPGARPVREGVVRPVVADRRRARPHPAVAAARGEGADGVGRLQRPHQRQPLHAAVERGRRPVPALHRDGRRVPRERPQLLHRRDATSTSSPRPRRATTSTSRSS